jgi:hypothetical protein
MLQKKDFCPSGEALEGAPRRVCGVRAIVLADERMLSVAANDETDALIVLLMRMTRIDLHGNR